MGDVYVSYLSKNKDRFEGESCCKCACPDYKKLEIVEDKHRFMAFCAANDIPCPKTVELTANTLNNCSTRIGFPSLIKPDFSVGARGITKVNSFEELQFWYPLISKEYGNCTLQEFIDNQEFYYNVMMYRDQNGKILSSAVIKIVRMFPVKAGSSSCCISVDLPDLIAVCKNTLDKLKWVGMADFDILQRLDNGEYKIIEINPRVPASLRGAAISGVNFPEIIINDLMGHPKKNYNYLPGRTLRYLGLDIMWLLKTKKLFNNNPSWLKFFGKNLYYQDIYANDLSTWWTWLAEGISKIGKRKQKLR